MAPTNPFTPMFGQMPPCVAGRAAFLEDMGRAFKGMANNPSLSTLIVGPRGTGKTVLLSRVAELAEQSGWIVAQVSACDGMLEDILLRIQKAGAHLLEEAPSSQLSSIEVGGILGASWEPLEKRGNWRSHMDRIFEQLEPQGAGVLITVDELNVSCQELVTLATTYQHFLSEGKRVSLVMAGLPGNVSGLINGKSTSFWRRACQQRLGRIDDEAVLSAFCETLELVGVAAEERALEIAVGEIGGFAYLMQLVGYWSFEDMARCGSGCMTLQNVQTGVAKAHDAMRNSVLSSTYADLSAGDIEFLAAMVQVASPATMRDVAEKMGVTQGYASQYRLRLIAQGIIGSRGRGKLDFEIPFFRQYVQEMVGDLTWPEEALGGNVSDERWDQARSFVGEFSVGSLT